MKIMASVDYYTVEAWTKILVVGWFICGLMKWIPKNVRDKKTICKNVIRYKVLGNYVSIHRSITAYICTKLQIHYLNPKK